MVVPDIMDMMSTFCHNMCHCVSICFRLLDLSFNRIKKIENINHLRKLIKLFLVNNKITEIENISQLTEVTMLELGANRIRVSRTYRLNSWL